METSVFLNKRVLITGSSGFIGSHLARRLALLGARVAVTEHDTPIRDSGYTVYPCDLKNRANVRELVQDTLPHFVFHLASQAIVNEAEDEVYNTFETNVMGSLNLLSCLHDVDRDILHGIIVSSSDKVFGRHENLPYTEQHELRGNWQVYETSKLCEDNIAQMSYHDWGLPMGITRCGNVYGGGDYHWNRLIPGIIRSYIRNEVPVIRSNGQYYRDYVYIDDIIDGYIKFAEFKYYASDSLDIVNLGTGSPSRVLDVAAIIAEQFTNASPPEIGYRADREIHRQYVGSDLAMELFDWKATTKLKDGVVKTVKWYVDFFNGQ